LKTPYISAGPENSAWHARYDTKLNGELSKWYYDHSFSMETPLNEEQAEQTEGMNDMFANISYRYNYLEKEYEEFIKTTNIWEKYLPNLYAFAAQLENPAFDKVHGANVTDIVKLVNLINNNSQLSGIARFLTLGFSIKGSNLDVGQGYLLGNHYGLQKYFADWICAWKNKGPQNSALWNQPLTTDPKDTKAFRTRTANILIPSSGEKIITDYDNKKYLFPMYTELNFSTGIPGVYKLFTTPLRDTDSFDRILQKVVDKSHDSSGFQDWQAFQQGKTGITTNIFDSWDIGDWLESALIDANLSTSEIEKIAEGEMLNGIYYDIVDLKTANTSPFYKAFTKFVLKQKIRKVLKSKLRTIEQVFAGQSAPTEILFFEIEKKRANVFKEDGATTKYYIAAPYEKNFLRFVDTQIKYDQGYDYTVYAHSIVIGNKYRYIESRMPGFDLNQMKDKLGKALDTYKTEDGTLLYSKEYNDTAVDTGLYGDFFVLNEPSLKLIRTEYFKFNTIKALDDPPVPPDVEILPFKNVNNRFLLQLRSNVGEYELTPVAIMQSDYEKFEAIKTAQIGRKIKKGKILFKADDHVAKFEIFRLEEPPSSYLDFSNAKITVLEDGTTSLVDKVKPNKKYYYTFRATDAHGHFSNPSPIYQCELVAERTGGKVTGAVYPIIEIYDLEKTAKINKINHKDMRQYIQIVPTIAQSMIKGISPENVTLGEVFGKQYKIRITSKSTGKKFDVNVTFDKKIPDIEVEKEQTMKDPCLWE